MCYHTKKREEESDTMRAAAVAGQWWYIIVNSQLVFVWKEDSLEVSDLDLLSGFFISGRVYIILLSHVIFFLNG